MASVLSLGVRCTPGREGTTLLCCPSIHSVNTQLQIERVILGIQCMNFAEMGEGQIHLATDT